MKTPFRFIALSLAVLMALFCFASCSDKKDEPKTKDTTNKASAAGSSDDNNDDLGFTEVEIFSGVEREFLNLNAVYFQPVDMTGGYKAEDYDCHLELDVSALENGFGYGKGDWVPYLTVEYEVKKGETVVSNGTFMPMAASDGPHYGANIKLDKADTYSVTFTFHNPEENGYLIHTDAETGPGGTFDKYFADGNLTVTYDGWDYTPQEW